MSTLAPHSLQLLQSCWGAKHSMPAPSFTTTVAEIVTDFPWVSQASAQKHKQNKTTRNTAPICSDGYMGAPSFLDVKWINSAVHRGPQRSRICSTFPICQDPRITAQCVSYLGCEPKHARVCEIWFSPFHNQKFYIRLFRWRWIYI